MKAENEIISTEIKEAQNDASKNDNERKDDTADIGEREGVRGALKKNDDSFNEISKENNKMSDKIQKSTFSQIKEGITKFFSDLIKHIKKIFKRSKGKRKNVNVRERHSVDVSNEDGHSVDVGTGHSVGVKEEHPVDVSNEDGHPDNVTEEHPDKKTPLVVKTNQD